MNNVTNNSGNDQVVEAVRNGEAPASVRTQQLLQELREKVTELPPEKHDEVHSVIDQIEEMIEKGPKALATAETTIVGLVKYFPHLLPWLTSQADVIIRSLSGG